MPINTWIAQEIYGGWFRPYSFLVFAGVLIALIVSYIRLRIRKIPTRTLELAVFPVIPIGLLGASFFGKLNFDKPIPFFELFAFWQPGLSVHGAILFGLIGGFFWFRYFGRRLHISTWVYCDRILPNVLLAQCVGRWGNFFNHEILGPPVSRSSLSWLPNFIKNSLFDWYIPNPIPPGFFPDKAVGLDGGPVNVDAFNQVQYHAPLFLYESIGDILLWLMIVFLIPWIWQKIARLWWEYRHDETVTTHFWKEYYYHLEISSAKLQAVCPPSLAQKTYSKRTLGLSRTQKLICWPRYCYQRTKEILSQDRRELEALVNPHKISIIRVGVPSMLYIALYNTLRFGLETQRQNSDLFIINYRVVDYVIIIGIAMFGFFGCWLAQFYYPRHWRNPGIFYEKHY